jgi:hypothetical protein
MTGKPIDVQRTLKYGTGAQDMLGLGGGLAIFLFALWVQQTQRFDAKAYLFMAVGIAIAIWAVVRLINAKEGLVLSPRGVFFRVPGVRSVFIPWSEVKAIETLDIPSGKAVVKDVTVLTISKAYYDKRIHTNAWARRLLPDWNAHFRLADEGHVQAALHHRAVGVAPEQLRAEVAARWRAFGGQKAKAE